MISLITNIQRYSLHDGAGIRTTVFFKGCPLRCIWCHNPETQSYDSQLLYDRERCLGCRRCGVACPSLAIRYKDGKVITDSGLCTRCGFCVDECPSALRQITGKAYTVEQLMKLLRQDLLFYEQSGGGVTLSGGEVMSIDMDYLEALMLQLHDDEIPVNIDTCGYAPFQDFMRILKLTDTFLYDIKVMDPAKHLRFTGVDNTLILENLIGLKDAGARINIRIPVITGVNASSEDMEDILHWLKLQGMQGYPVNLLPYHNTGSGKYEKLGVDYEGTDFAAPSGEEMQAFAHQFLQAGFTSVKIGG